MKKAKIMLVLLSALTLVGCKNKVNNLNENSKERFIIKKIDYFKEIWIDKETGVNYLYSQGASGGRTLTVMYDKNGKVLITDLEEIKKEK